MFVKIIDRAGSEIRGTNVIDNMKNKVVLVVVFMSLFSCKKSSDNIVVNTNLTGCPVNTTCSYSYNENSDFNGSTQLTNGNYRVFGYNSVNKSLCDLTTQLYFKTSLSNSDFLISGDQIKSGQVAIYNTICACCDLIANLQ